MVDEGRGQAAEIGCFRSPQQHIRRQRQRHQAVDGIEQYRVSREPDQPIAVATRCADKESTQDGGQKEQKMPDRDRRYFRLARNSRRDVGSEKVLCALPDRIVERVDRMRDDLHDRHHRIGATQAQKHEQQTRLRCAELFCHPAKRSSREQCRPDRDPDLIHRAEEQRCQTEHHDRQPELDRSERLGRQSQMQPVNHREAIETFSLKLPAGFYRRIDVGYCVRSVGHRTRRVVDQAQQLVVVHHLGIGDVHDVLGSHLEAGGQQHP